MTPEEGIESLDELRKQLNARRAHLDDEASEIAEQWEGLRRAGGQRADHAAALLSRLRPHLRELARFAGAIEQQIDSFVADPFGRKCA